MADLLRYSFEFIDRPDIEEIVYEYAMLYGPQIALLAVLLAITFFRREISCNHTYHEETEEESSPSDWNDEKTEAILDGASQYCSGASLRPILDGVVDLLQAEDNRNLNPDELLEKMGNFYSGDSFTAFMFANSPSRTATAAKSTEPDSISDLQNDTRIHILSFLHPKDILSFATASKALNTLVNDGLTSNVLWKRLYERDYSWIQEWDVGREALERSGTIQQMDRETYFRLGLCYVDWLLAGLNTADRCFVGLQGHIYDMTPFLNLHPGSPETLMAHAGKDSSHFFETIRHSAGARKIARTLCVVVNRWAADPESFGLSPTNVAVMASEDIPTTEAPEVKVNHSIWKTAPKRIIDSFRKERQDASRQANTLLGELSITGEANVYYDPVQRSWKAWYSDQSLFPHFPDVIS